MQQDARSHAQCLREKMTPPSQTLLMEHSLEDIMGFSPAFAESYAMMLQALQTASANGYTLEGLCAAETIDRITATYQGKEGLTPQEALRAFWEYEHMLVIPPLVGPREVHPRHTACPLFPQEHPRGTPDAPARSGDGPDEDTDDPSGTHKDTGDPDSDTDEDDGDEEDDDNNAEYV